MKTIKQHIKKLNSAQFEELTRMCFESRKLYNSALYIVNSYFKETNCYIGYVKLYHAIKDNQHYKAINSKMAQQILRLVNQNFMSFFSLLKMKGKGTYNGSVNPPKYLPKDSMFNLILPNDQIKLVNGALKITKDLRLPFSHTINGTIKQCIIKPHKLHNYFTIYLQYEETPLESPELSKENCLAIDLGLNNFASCISNVGRSFIMNGKPLKAYNQLYNKRKASIQAELKTKNNKFWSNRLERLTINRQNYIDNYLNQTVAYLIKQCLKYNIGTIVCGYNELWKQEINLGKKTNQNFVSISFWVFKRKLQNKCAEYSISFVQQEESYTSKCSFLDKEPIEKREVYAGKRVKRGLFRTATGLLINADIQAAANILTKAVPNAHWVDGIEGCIVNPSMLKHCFNL